MLLWHRVASGCECVARARGSVALSAGLRWRHERRWSHAVACPHPHAPAYACMHAYIHMHVPTRAWPHARANACMATCTCQRVHESYARAYACIREHVVRAYMCPSRRTACMGRALARFMVNRKCLIQVSCTFRVFWTIRRRNPCRPPLWCARTRVANVLPECY